LRQRPASISVTTDFVAKADVRRQSDVDGPLSPAQPAMATRMLMQAASRSPEDMFMRTYWMTLVQAKSSASRPSTRQADDTSCFWKSSANRAFD